MRIRDKCGYLRAIGIRRIMDFTRLFEILEYQQLRYPQKVAVAGREANAWRSWSSAEALAERDRMSAGLLELGLRPGDRIGMLTHCGSPQWVIADGAMLQVGMVPVPIHSTCRTDEIEHIAADAKLRACFVSDASMLEKMQGTGVVLDFIIVFEEDALGTSVKNVASDGGTDGSRPERTRILSWSSVACDPDEQQAAKIQYYRDGIAPTQLATLLYTSGTTGLPKGVMLTHDNIVSNVKSVLAIVPVRPKSRVVSFLPMSHIFERMVTYTYQAAGASLWFADSIERLPKTLLEVRPEFFSAVPRVLERMYERLLEERNKGGQIKRRIMDWAIALGERFPYAGEQAMPLDYYFKQLLADFLVFRHWRRRLGGKIQYIAVGAAALQPRLGRLFSAASIDVREGYGLTETSPVLAFNRFEPGGVHFGTVGIPAPGVEVRISAERDEAGNGEIEVRGPNVMVGYLNLPEETAARFTADGWFRTGDVGSFVHKRFLKISGRKSDIFKTTTGKFVAPAYVEQQLARSPYISQSMVLGANEAAVAALIVPDFVQLEAWCREHDVHWTAPQYMVLNTRVVRFFRQEIDAINAERLGSIEKIRHFTLLHEAWTPENGLLTPTLKVKRNEVSRVFEREIKDMYMNLE